MLARLENFSCIGGLNREEHSGGEGGDTHKHYIDARGSSDPAQTVALIDRYMKVNGPAMAAATLKAGRARTNYAHLRVAEPHKANRTHAPIGTALTGCSGRGIFSFVVPEWRSFGKGKYRR